MLSEFTALTVVVMLVIKSISLESESDTRVSSDVSICLTEPCGLCGLFDLQHTFAKWLRPPQLRQFVPHAGHFSFLGACSPPQNRHVCRFSFGSRGLPLVGTLTRESRCRIASYQWMKICRGQSCLLLVDMDAPESTFVSHCGKFVMFLVHILCLCFLLSSALFLERSA